MHMPGLKPELGLDCPVHLFAIGQAAETCEWARPISRSGKCGALNGGTAVEFREVAQH
jgi:hypothetical protein